MLIVGENLLGLIRNESIVDEGCFDTTCFTLSLGNSVIEMIPNDEHSVLRYGDEVPYDVIKKTELDERGVIIPAHSSLLACSHEKVHMPLGYFGLLQTKGSLARLFVSINCSDGQIDPGFCGCVTFEIMNCSNFDIVLHKKQKIGNVYIFKTSTDNCLGYSGKYDNSSEPTISRSF